MVTINEFPDEILEQILFNLPPYGDLQNCALVCKRWSLIVHSVRRLTTMSLLKGLTDNSTLIWQTPDNKFADMETPVSVTPLPSTSSLKPPPIAKRFSHSAVVYDNEMYVFGGGSSTATTFNDLWRFDLSTRLWHRPLSTGTYPSPKACASIVAHRGKLVVFGGWRHPTVNRLHYPWRLFNELHVYSIAEKCWTHHAAVGVMGVDYPPPMTGHSASVHGERMVVFGGFQQDRGEDDGGGEHGYIGDDAFQTGCSNSIWCLDLVTFVWQKMLTSASAPQPQERYGHYQVQLAVDRLLVLGGCGGPNNMFNDAWVLHMPAVGGEWRWQAVRIGNKKWAASYMWCNPACRIGSKIILLGPTSGQPSAMQRMEPTHWARRLQLDHHHHHHNDPYQEPNPQQQPPQPIVPQRRDPLPDVRPLAPVPPPAAAPLRSPSQIVEEANRRLQLERNRQSAQGPSGSGAGSAPQRRCSNNSRPGPSSGVLTRAADRRRSNEHVDDDEEAVNRRLKRNLQLKGRDDDADQFMPKRFNQPLAEPLGMSAFSVPTVPSAVPSGSGGGHGQSPPSAQQPIQHELRMEFLRRMEQKMRLIQNDLSSALVAPAVFKLQDEDDEAVVVDAEPIDMVDNVRIDGVGEFVIRIEFHEPIVPLQSPHNRTVRDCIGVFVCDISALLGDDGENNDDAADGADGADDAERTAPELNWLECHNGGIIDGAPERLILSSLVAGNGELIMFGGMRRSAGTLVSNSLHILSFQRDVL